MNESLIEEIFDHIQPRCSYDFWIKEVIPKLQKYFLTSEKVEYCISDGDLKGLNPPRYRCLKCGKDWKIGTETPVCNKIEKVEIEGKLGGIGRCVCGEDCDSFYKYCANCGKEIVWID